MPDGGVGEVPDGGVGQVHDGGVPCVGVPDGGVGENNRVFWDIIVQFKRYLTKAS